MKDLTGQRFGKLTALRPTGRKIGTNTAWLCQCDCGEQVEINGASLSAGRSKSCGCLQRDVARENSKIARNRLNQYEYKDNTSLCNLTQKTPTTNTSGRKGVWFNKKEGKWGAYIYFQRQRKHLGYFKKFEDAVKAREKAEEDLFEPMLNRYGRTLCGDA